MEIPPVVRYVVGYQNGAKWMKPDVNTLNVYIPSFVDPAKGKETGQSMIDQGCDVIFGLKLIANQELFFRAALTPWP